MKKLFAVMTLCLLFSSITIGCERASLNRIGKDVYYVQIKGEGAIEKVEGRSLRNYTWPAYDEDGVKKQITFRSTKKKTTINEMIMRFYAFMYIKMIQIKMKYHLLKWSPT